MRGDGQLEISQRFAKKMNSSMANAGRLIATESAYFASLSEHDSMKELGVEKYDILATLDSRTSDICREMDGKTFTMSEFKPGVTAPPFHPWCRSCKVPHIEGWNGLRAARGDDGKTYYVPGSMTYKDWKNVFVDKKQTPEEWQKVQLLKHTVKTNSSKDDIINKNLISGALNPESTEAYKHAKLFYEEVRRRKDDYKTIAQRTGFPEEFVLEVKNHLFMQKHELDGQRRYFYPDYNIAQSWQRLSDKNMEILKEDLILLQHEHLEAEYMKQGLSQAEAHERAGTKFNYAKIIKDKRKAKKRK